LVSAVGRIAGGYRETWHASGTGGRAILLGSGAFVARVVGFSFLLPLYAKASGFSTEQYGLLVAIQNITPIIALIPVLVLARRGWDRRLMMLGPTIGMLGMLMLIAGRDAPYGVWMAAVILCGGSSATYWTLSDPLLAEATTPEFRAQAYALKWLFFTIGSSVGALAAGAVPEGIQRSMGTTERDAYWVTLFVLAGLDGTQIWIFRRVPIRSLGHRMAGAAGHHVPVSLLIGSLILFGLAEALFGFGYNSIRPFMSLFLTEREGLSSGTAGLVIASTAIVAALGALLMPVLAERIGNARALGLLRFAGALSVTAWFAVGELGAVIALTLLYYGLLDGTSALYAAEVMGRLPAAARDVMAGLNNVLWSVVGATAAALSGYLQDLPSGGFGLAFSVGALGYLLSAAWCVIMLPRIALREVTPARS
jgi:MFS family permease